MYHRGIHSPSGHGDGEVRLVSDVREHGALGEDGHFDLAVAHEPRDAEDVLHTEADQRAGGAGEGVADPHAVAVGDGEAGLALDVDRREVPDAAEPVVDDPLQLREQDRAHTPFVVLGDPDEGAVKGDAAAVGAVGESHCGDVLQRLFVDHINDRLVLLVLFGSLKLLRVAAFRGVLLQFIAVFVDVAISRDEHVGSGDADALGRHAFAESVLDFRQGEARDAEGGFRREAGEGRELLDRLREGVLIPEPGAGGEFRRVHNRPPVSGMKTAAARSAAAESVSKVISLRPG